MVITTSFACPVTTPGRLSQLHHSPSIRCIEIKFARCPGIVGVAAAEAGKSVNNNSDRRHVDGRSRRDNSDTGEKTRKMRRKRA